MKIVLNGDVETTWAEFVAGNALTDDEAQTILATIEERGFYEGGGGAAAEFTIEKAPVPPPFYTVAVYLADRKFGGSEEGGWYYEAGERRDDPEETGCVPAVFRNTDEPQAIACQELTQARLDATVNKGRREISSVLSTGRYIARICDGWPETHYPAVRPHYE